MNTLGQVNAGVVRLLQDIEGSGLNSPVELCRVERVNPERYTVEAYFMSSAMTRDDVPFCFPYQNLDKGILYMPEVGAIGVAVWGRHYQPIILGFISMPMLTPDNTLSSRNEDFGDFALEYLYEGEYLIQSSGRSFVKLDRLGNVTIGTPGNTYIKVEDVDDHLLLNSSQFSATTESGDTFKGFVEDGTNNRVGDLTRPGKYFTYETERVYDVADETVNVADEDVSIALEITKGNVFSLNPDNSVTFKTVSGTKVCYEIGVTDVDGTKRIVMDIGRDGRLFFGQSNHKAVARVGDTVSVNVNGTVYTGTITTGSSKTYTE